jgi:hypothetical protein
MLGIAAGIAAVAPGIRARRADGTLIIAPEVILIVWMVTLAVAVVLNGSGRLSGDHAAGRPHIASTFGSAPGACCMTAALSTGVS